MRVSQVRVGEKFVLDDRGGVWEMLGEDQDGRLGAKCVFGPREYFGKEEEMNPASYCYVLFEERKTPPKEIQKEIQKVVVKDDGSEVVNTTIKVVDEENDILIKEIVNPTTSQVSCMSRAEILRFIPPGKRRNRTYNVAEFAYDIDENTFYMFVMSGTIGGKDEDDQGSN